MTKQLSSNKDKARAELETELENNNPEDFHDFSSIMLEIKTTHSSVFFDISGYQVSGDTILNTPSNSRVADESRILYTDNYLEKIASKMQLAKEHVIYKKFFSDEKSRDFAKKFLIYNGYFKAEDFEKNSPLYQYAEYLIMVFFAEVSYYYGLYYKDEKNQISDKEKDHFEFRKADAIKLMENAITTRKRDISLEESALYKKAMQEQQCASNLSTAKEGLKSLEAGQKKMLKQFEIIGNGGDSIPSRLLKFRLGHCMFMQIGDDEVKIDQYNWQDYFKQYDEHEDDDEYMYECIDECIDNEQKQMTLLNCAGYKDLSNWQVERELDKELEPFSHIEFLMHFCRITSTSRDRSTFRTALKNLKEGNTYLKKSRNLTILYMRNSKRLKKRKELRRKKDEKKLKITTRIVFPHLLLLDAAESLYKNNSNFLKGIYSSINKL